MIKLDKTFHFLAGLPRSCSTVIQAVLSQNPNIYGSATSPLMDMLFYTEQAWAQTTQSSTSGSPEQLANIYVGVINGLYYHIDKPIIIDKHRAWARNLKGIKQFFPDAKCICTVRSIPDIIASFIKLVDKQDYVTYIDKDVIKAGKPINTATRADAIWNNYVQNTWESLKIGYETNKDNLLLIESEDFIVNPQQQLDRIYDFISQPSFEHTFTNIINTVAENDEGWGLQGLHTIKPTVVPFGYSTEEILGKQTFDKYTNMNLEFWRQ